MHRTLRLRHRLVSSGIKSIQYGSITLGGASTTGTWTGRAVDMANAVLVDLRQSNNWTGGSQPAYTSTALEFTNPTTVTATRNAAGGTQCVAAFMIVELYPGAFRSVQHGVASGNGNRSVTISRVNPDKAVVMSLGMMGDSGGADIYFYGTLGISDPTTVSITRQAAAGAGMGFNFVVLEGF